MIPTLPPLSDRAARVLIVHDDEGTSDLLARALRHEGHHVDVKDRGEGVLDAVRVFPPDLVLLDMHLPDCSGLEVLGDLRMMDEGRLIPVVLLSASLHDEEMVIRGLLAGADDFVSTPARIREILARVRVQLRNRRDRELLRVAQRERVQLIGAARTDPLTGVGNRRAADEMLQRAFEGTGSLLAMLIDIDHFKSINDTWGHGAGDEVLRALGGHLHRASRNGDLVARWGGEEFLVVIREAPVTSHLSIAKRFQGAIGNLKLPESAGIKAITASMGAASWDASAPPPAIDRLVEVADEALYAAKRGGRNRVVLAKFGPGGDAWLVEGER